VNGMKTIVTIDWEKVPDEIARPFDFGVKR
jgi:hypothetical protein